ncbi:MAG: preprotein translocase subunit SecE [Patescibacteria group bacterium]
MSFIEYLKNTRGELRHVSWPTRRQTAYFTVIVIAFSLLTAFFLGFFDFLFTELLNLFVA